MKEGIIMNNISLKKITVFVSTCVLATYFVSADENVAALVVPSTNVAASKMIAGDVKKKTDNGLPTLVSQFDNDKNGLLSKAEVMGSKNKMLVTHFKDIDKK